MSVGQTREPAVLRLLQSALRERLVARRSHHQERTTSAHSPEPTVANGPSNWFTPSFFRVSPKGGEGRAGQGHSERSVRDEHMSERGRRHAKAIVGLGVVVGGLLVTSASPALAARQRIFTGSFGCAEGPGCTTLDPYPLATDPWSVAVNRATGDVYVADGANHRVQEFTEKGEFVLMFGQEVNRTKVESEGKVASEAESVCTAAEVAMGTVCQAGTASSAPGGFESVERGGASPVMFVARQLAGRVGRRVRRGLRRIGGGRGQPRLEVRFLRKPRVGLGRSERR